MWINTDFVMMGQMSVDKVGQIHAVEYGLEEVEFEAGSDFKVRVGGMDVAARRGETTRVPYWAGLVLEKNKLGSMRLPDMITELKQVLLKERHAGSRAFQALEPLFYVKLKAVMRHLEGRDYDRVYDRLLELFRMRNAKIVSKASSMKLGADMKSKLTVEEQAFYNVVHRTCAEFEAQITAISSDGMGDMEVVHEEPRRPGRPSGGSGAGGGKRK
ncbi:MAG: DNA replication complex GINS family protein [Nitrosopumilaceae archaeon]|nr:DNA replication complex GINS family protein [Nitrosopumilaceae archaeon]